MSPVRCEGPCVFYCKNTSHRYNIGRTSVSYRYRTSRSHPCHIDITASISHRYRNIDITTVSLRSHIDITSRLRGVSPRKKSAFPLSFMNSIRNVSVLPSSLLLENISLTIRDVCVQPWPKCAFCVGGVAKTRNSYICGVLPEFFNFITE